MLDLDEAVRSALDFAEADGETLVIVTADHAHTSQIVDSTPPATLSTALTTVDGSTMKIAYGTAAAGGSQQHTGTQLRVAGYGPGAANVVGLIDQTDNFFTIANALQLDRDLVSLSADATIAAPTQVAPGATFDVLVSGLDGDRQASATFDGASLGTVDVIDGVATFSVTAPATLGERTVSVTGVQTRTVRSAAVSVVADPVASPSAPATGGAGGAGTGTGGSGSGSGTAAGSGPLAFTGSDALPALVLALLLAGAGTVLVARRRRRTVIDHSGL